MRSCLIALLLTAIAAAANAAIPQSEHDALVAFYNATGGANWTDHTNWLGAAGSECTWFGVTCNEGGSNVIGLDIEANNLSGAIPADLAKLTKLESLVLAGSSSLGGNIPQELGTLTQLNELSLQDNGLTGTIPASLANLSKIEVLSLYGNKLSGPIPPQLFSLPALRSFAVAGNQLTGAIPPEIGHALALQYFDAGDNQLSGSLPKELGTIATLQILTLNDNKFSGAIPPELGSMASLTELNLAGNQLSGAIPPQLGSLGALTYLSLAANALTGTIPTELARLTNLTTLALSGNQLTGSVPSTLGALSSLQELLLANNKLNGAIPVEITSLANLTNLDLSENQLTGSIPDLSRMRHLKYLTLGENQLSGPVPTSITALPDLIDIVLYNNALSGPLPDSIGNLTKLEMLSVGTNQLTGSIPQSIGNLSALTFIDLGSNQLTGTIPPQIGQLANLQNLYLGSNQLTGTIPPTIGNLAKLEMLDVSYNFLSGTIPPLGGLKAAQSLYFNDNNLEGTLPADIAVLTALSSLWIADNRLSGPIPTTIGSLTGLHSLFMGSNAFRGAVPQEITRLTSLDPASLDLSYNALTSTDPNVLAFIRTRQGSDLGDTQTVAPTNVTAGNATDRSVVVSWTPIKYDYNDGGYQVTSTAAGSADLVAMTADKGTDSVVVRGLKPSTTYSFTVKAITNPHDVQQNLLASNATAAVTATTTAAVVAPADVELTAGTKGLIQVGGVPQNQDSFILTNFGDATAAVALSTADTFFTISPASFNLAGGASQTVTLTSVPQPPNSYYGWISVTVNGADADFGVDVSLLSVAKPTGSVIAQPLVTRVDTAGDPNTTTLGTVVYRNVGTATLNGILVSDVPWITTPPATVTIYPGETGTINFTVDRAKRPDAGTFGGALSGNLRLLYLDGEATPSALGVRTSSSAAIGRPRPIASSPSEATPPDETSGGSGRGRPHSSDSTPPPGLSVSIVTVVDTSKPPVGPGTIPAIVAPEVARFVAGVSSASSASSKLLTDISVANAFGVGSINDLKMYFTPAGASASSVASFGSVAPAQSIALANVAGNIYGSTAQTGTLQIRSARINDLLLNATRTNVAGNVAVRSAIPIFRSDRSIAAGQSLYLTGVAKTTAIHTTLDVQETSGQPATIQIRFANAAGTTVGTTRPADTVPAFGLLELGDAVPAGAVTAIVTNQTGSTGRVVAYATVTNDASGIAFSIVDWSRYFALKPTDTLDVPYAQSVTSSSSRRRAVAKAAAQTTRTELTLFNPGPATANAILHFYDPSGSTTSQTLSVPPGQTRVVPDAVQLLGRSGAGNLTLDPLKGSTLAVTARLLNSSGGAEVSGTALPVLSGAAGLRLGQMQTFAGLDDSSPATVAAKTPGTSSTSFGIFETGGDRVTVRATMRYVDGRSLLVAQNVSRDFELGPYQSVVVDQMASAILGSARPALGDLHGVQLVLQVVRGNGAATVFTVTTDNATGSAVLRVE